MVEYERHSYLEEVPDNRDVESIDNWWKRRNRVERKLCLSALILFVVSIGLTGCISWFYFYASAETSDEINKISLKRRSIINSDTTEVCLSAGCRNAAKNLLKNMNQTKDPCTDFFEFACGSYITNAKIPEEESDFNQFDEVKHQLLMQIRGIIEKPIYNNDTHSEKIVKTFYASCMNLAKIAEIGLKPIDHIIQAIGGWPVLMGEAWNDTNLDWKELVFRLNAANLSSTFFIDTGIIPDFKNNSKYILAIDEPSPGLRSSYLKLGKNNSVVQAYLQYMIESAAYWGASRPIAEKEMEDVLDFELNLLKLMSSPDDKSNNVSQIYNEMDISQLYQLNSEVDWIYYLETVYKHHFNEDDRIVVGNRNYTKNFTKLLNETSIRTLTNYAVGRIIRDLTLQISDDFVKLKLEIFKNATGVESRSPRWIECIEYTKKYLDVAIGAMYVKRFFKPEAKTIVKDLVDSIQDQMKDTLNKVNWADSKTINRAKEKLDIITSHVAYPEELLNDTLIDALYDDITVEKEYFFGNLRSISSHYKDAAKHLIHAKVTKNNWSSVGGVARSNAEYHRLNNAMNLPAGILQGIFFDHERPQYMNFAAIGSIIGHELTHGFDETGSQFDKNGHLENWWEPEASRAFKTRAQCIIQQYSNYSDPETNVQLDGKQTINENIADNGGLKQAFYAYQTWAQKHKPEPKLPGLDYTIDQLFWISFANVWCTKMKPEAIRLLITLDTHSIGRFRVNGPLSNMKEFAEDFQCQPGSPMNPSVKCNVW